MPDHDLKQMTLDELLDLLATAQRNLALSTQRKKVLSLLNKIGTSQQE